MSHTNGSDGELMGASPGTGRSAKLVASCFAMTAFAVAIIAGLAAGNGPGAVLVRALLAMIGCYVIGLIIGMVCQSVLVQHMAAEQRDTSDAERETAPSRAESEEEVLTV